jgi:hypothetical protein
MGDTRSDFILEILSREDKYIYYLLAESAGLLASHPRRCGRSAGHLCRPSILAIGLRRRCGARRAEGERHLFPAPIPRQGP